ncbi:hypothetical protein CULC22_00679 [Corynebacterium ulcerans BR-AD22]|nr:hypothetical protein CULC22_00679 [Corynebacterium ulcerans BR-AD22]
MGKKFNSDVLDEFLAYNAELIEQIRVIQDILEYSLRLYTRNSWSLQ